MLKQQNDHMQRLIVEKTGQQAFSMSNINAFSTSNIDGNLDNSVPSEISTQQQLTFDVNAVSAALASGAVNANTTTATCNFSSASKLPLLVQQLRIRGKRQPDEAAVRGARLRRPTVFQQSGGGWRGPVVQEAQVTGRREQARTADQEAKA